MSIKTIITALVILHAVDYSHPVITFPKGPEYSEPPSNLLQQTNAAFNIGLKILNSSKGLNPVISPVNLYTCLWFLHLGARGDTKIELADFLRVSDDSTLAYHVGKLMDVHTANAAFVDLHTPVKLQYYQATNNSIFSVDFKDDFKSRNIINEWVSSQTKGSISNLLSEPLVETTKAVIVSALYFNATWQFPFSTSATKSGKFEVSPQETVQVPFMVGEAPLPIFRGPNYNAIGLPYANNGFTLYLLMPNVAGPRALKSLFSHLSADEVSLMISSMVEEPVIVTVPKLQLNYRMQLRSPLKSLGVNKMFDPSFADFSDMVEETSGSKVFVSDMIQSVHLDVDEGGTRGGAATAAFLTKSGRWVFRANRPFIYFLRHSSGVVLFLGIVTNPQ